MENLALKLPMIDAIREKCVNEMKLKQYFVT